MVKPEVIAKIAHATIRAFNNEFTNTNIPIWECVSHARRNKAIEDVKHILANPMITAEQSHENFVDHHLKEGWKYGVKYNEKEKTNPWLVPYDKLPFVVRGSNQLFRKVVLNFLEIQ